MTAAARTIDLTVLGTRVRVELDGQTQEFERRFRAAWHLCTTGRGSADTAAMVRVDAAGAASEQSTMTNLTQSITRAAIGAQAGRCLMLHAGALANQRTGASIVYVAPGGTGKTTLTRRLGPGLGYVTDECVAITESGEILPYPKPLSVRPHPFPGWKDEVAPEALGLAPPHVAPWVAGIVILRRTGREPTPQVAEVDPLDALVMLAPETSSLGLLDRPLHRLAALLESTGAVLLVVDGAQSRVVRVSALGLAIHELTTDRMPLTTLASRLGSRFGAPPDGDLEEQTARQVDLLVAQELLAWDGDGSADGGPGEGA